MQASVSLKWDSWGLNPDLSCLNIYSPDHIYKYIFVAYVFILFMYSENDLPVSETDHLAVLSFLFLAKKNNWADRVQKLAVIKDQYLFLKLIANKK